MLQHLIIKNFAIIQDEEIDFKEGMNVLLGETGAGKSIIIDAINLLRGEKSSFDKIRNGETKAFIEGTFIVSNKTKDLISSQYEDLIEDDNTLIVSRSLDINNKSICKVNMHSFPLSSLRTLMESVLDIHSQHKDNSYFDEEKQISLLDQYILKLKTEEIDKLLYVNKENIIDKYKTSYKEYLSLIKEYKKLKEEKLSIDEIEYLSYQVDELEKANIQENEIEEIDDELRELESFEKIADIFTKFNDEYNYASNHLYEAKTALNKLNSDKYEEKKEKFISSYYELEDSYSELNNIFSSLSNDMSRLDYLKERKSLLNKLKRKYGSSTDEILSKFIEMKKTLELQGDYEYHLSKMEENISLKEKELKCECELLNKLRLEGGKLLTKEVNKELSDIGLENAEFALNILEKDDFDINGNEIITFILKANKGGKFLPLNKTASLGETSRINLALKNVFNKLDPVETIIFDEIDTGISGEIGNKVGLKVHDISKYSQALVISHLPSMVSNGDYHYFVSKSVKDNVTTSHIEEINGERLITELAKMISGDKVTSESLALASSLLHK